MGCADGLPRGAYGRHIARFCFLVLLLLMNSKTVVTKFLNEAIVNDRWLHARRCRISVPVLVLDLHRVSTKRRPWLQLYVSHDVKVFAYCWWCAQVNGIHGIKRQWTCSIPFGQEYRWRLLYYMYWESLFIAAFCFSLFGAGICPVLAVAMLAVLALS